MKAHIRIVVPIVLLLTFVTSCGGTHIGPQPPETPVPVSQDAADRLVSRVSETANSVVAGGPFTFTFTEEEITSFVVLRAHEYMEGDLPLQNIQIMLEDGKISIYGEASAAGVTAGVLIEIVPSVDAEGKLALEISSAQMGPIGLGSDLLGPVTDMLEDTFDRLLSDIKDQYILNSIVIADGQLTISGVALQ